MSMPDTWEISAVRYATNTSRKWFHNCLFCRTGDVHDAPMPMDFYVWVLKGPGRTILVDTGSRDWMCRHRGHEFIRNPIDGLTAIGVEADQVDDVIITHMHWDHAGNVDLFKNAQVHIQLAEYLNVTGPDMAVPEVNNFFLVDDVCTIVRRLFDGKLHLHQGPREIASGVWVHETRGHTAGMQLVRVFTQRGWVVLASDAAHFYESFRGRNPYPITYNLHDAIKTFDLCLELADSPEHIIPGHDPLVLRNYPGFSSTLAGDVVRLDLEPIGGST